MTKLLSDLDAEHRQFIVFYRRLTPEQRHAVKALLLNRNPKPLLLIQNQGHQLNRHIRIFMS